MTCLHLEKTVTARLSTLGRIIDDCRTWLASLPSTATLEQVTPEIETGLTLPAVRARIQRLEEFVKALRSVPTPSADIEQRVKAYLDALTKPIVHGVAAGEQLVVEWPRARDQFAAAPHVDLFVLAAFLQPDVFAARLLASIHKAAPPSDRDAQVKDLEQQIEQLQRMEEVLLTSTGAARISGRRPEVILVLLRSFTQPCQPSPKGSSGRPAHRPFRGLLGVHSRYGLHTRAVTNS